MSPLLLRPQQRCNRRTLLLWLLVCILSCIVVQAEGNAGESTVSQHLRQLPVERGAAGSSTSARKLSIFDKDGRQQVSNSSAYPYSAVGLLRWSDDITCTATLVAPSIVLTAAECVLNSDGELRESPESSSVFSLPQTSEVKTALVTRVHKQSDFWTKWTKNTYVLVELDEELGTTYGELHLPSANVFAQNAAMNVQLVGYGDNGEAGKCYQLCKVHFPSEFGGPDYLLHHDCDVSAKRSPGSPMLIRSTDLDTYIIGIHTNAIGDDPIEDEVTKTYPSYNDSVANRGVLGSLIQPHLSYLLHRAESSFASSEASSSLEGDKIPVSESPTSSGGSLDIGSASRSLSASQAYDGQTDAGSTPSASSSSAATSLAAPHLGIAATAAYSCIGLVCASWLAIIFIAARRIRSNR
ncbi:hypothetical protein PRIC1_001347 [Phytophthora ramorum]